MRSNIAYLFFSMTLGSVSFGQVGVQRGGIYNQVNPSGPISMMSVVVPGQTTRNYSQYFVVNIRNSCFGSEVRGTTQPLGPNALIQLNFALRRGSVTTNVQVEYPGRLAMAPNGVVSPTYAPIQPRDKQPSGMRAATYGNILRLEIPIASMQAIDPATGSVIEANIPKIEDYSFIQRPDPAASPFLTLYTCPTGYGSPPRCAYVTVPGPLAAKVNIMQPYGSFSAEMHVTFPGQSGFCSSHF